MVHWEVKLLICGRSPYQTDHLSLICGANEAPSSAEMMDNQDNAPTNECNTVETDTVIDLFNYGRISEMPPSYIDSMTIKDDIMWVMLFVNSKNRFSSYVVRCENIVLLKSINSL